MSRGGAPRAETRLQIGNANGLHMRAAQLLVEALRGLDAEVTIRKGDQSANGRSIISLMMLAAGQGTWIEVVAEGADAEAAVAALRDLVAGNFGQEK